MEELTRRSDFISRHTPLVEATYPLVNAEFLAHMKPTAYLMNAVRGPLIGEAALPQAVRSGQIAGVGLDVLTVEPPTPDNPLLQEPRILVTPHSAWYAEEVKIDLRTRCAEEARVLRAQPPRFPANQIEDTTS